MDDPRDYFISRVVQGKSFLEVGGLWGIVNEKVSVAHRFGARSLTIIDVTLPDSSLWSSFRSRMLEKGIPDCVAISGDICETSFNEIFDVVHCSGVLYHLPNPLRMLDVLRKVTQEYLILTSAITQEVIKNEAGVYRLPPSGVVFVPALNDNERGILKAYWEKAGAVAYGLTEKVTYAMHDFGPWWWLPTVPALVAMCKAAGFEVVDQELMWNNNALTLLLK